MSIKRESLLVVTDNCGAQLVKCVGTKNGFAKGFSRTADFIKVSLRKVDPHKELLKPGIKVYMALISACRANTRRLSGHFIRFSRNSVIILGADNKLFATRFRGPVSQEIRRRKMSNVLMLSHRII